MVKDIAVPGEGGVVTAVARMADSVVAEWKRGRQRLHRKWPRRVEWAAQESLIRPNADDMLERLDPLSAVRWRGSR